MSPLLQGQGLALIRGGKLLFEGMDINLGAGQAIHLTGPNGSGKSSLIRLIAGLLRPSAGRIERVEAALADEGMALDRELSLQQALAFWQGPRLSDALTAFHLDDLSNVPVRLLSTGQAKRAKLARAMASGAPLWLLDEPFNGLDRDGAQRLDEAIASHRQAGGAVVAASHLPLSGEWQVVELGR
jgi:heme exporter protein A